MLKCCNKSFRVSVTFLIISSLCAGIVSLFTVSVVGMQTGIEENLSESRHTSENIATTSHISIKEAVDPPATIHSSERSHTCEICNKAFTRATSLKRHLRIHTQEKPYVCDVCGEAFSRRSFMKRHLQTIHTKETSSEEKHVCDICKKAFSSANNLNRHLLIHSSGGSHTCEICGKAFIQGTSLLRHLRIHTQEKPFVCDVCGKSFSRRNYVKRHSQAVHAKENEDAQSEDLNSRAHEKHVCEICKKVFSSASGLNAIYAYILMKDRTFVKSAVKHS